MLFKFERMSICFWTILAFVQFPFFLMLDIFLLLTWVQITNMFFKVWFIFNLFITELTLEKFLFFLILNHIYLLLYFLLYFYYYLYFLIFEFFCVCLNFTTYYLLYRYDWFCYKILNGNLISCLNFLSSKILSAKKWINAGLIHNIFNN
jgi:hypothetical protein